MRRLELWPDDGARRPAPPMREVVVLARAARVGGGILIAIGVVLNAVGVVWFGAVAALNVLFMALDDSGSTEFEAPVVLLYSVVPGTAMILLGSLYAAGTNGARLRLAAAAIAGSLLVGPHVVGGALYVLRCAGAFGAAIV